MDARIYLEMKRVEDLHWWFVGRRAIVRNILKGLRALMPAAQPRILDAGCGTGGNLRMLSEFGHVTGLEYEPVAADLARGRGPWKVALGSLPENIPFDQECFDMVVMTDVLEHIEDDVGALRAVGTLLTPHGHLLLTVPAFQFLWSNHDVQHHHKRRYTAGTLRAAIEAADLEIVMLSYFNFWLFPLVAAARLLSREHADGDAESLLRIPPRPINSALAALFGGESFLLNRTRLPFGVSLVAVLRPRRA